MKHAFTITIVSQSIIRGFRILSLRVLDDLVVHIESIFSHKYSVSAKIIGFCSTRISVVIESGYKFHIKWVIELVLNETTKSKFLP